MSSSEVFGTYCLVYFVQRMKQWKEWVLSAKVCESQLYIKQTVLAVSLYV